MVLPQRLECSSEFPLAWPRGARVPATELPQRRCDRSARWGMGQRRRRRRGACPGRDAEVARHLSRRVSAVARVEGSGSCRTPYYSCYYVWPGEGSLFFVRPAGDRWREPPSQHKSLFSVQFLTHHLLLAPGTVESQMSLSAARCLRVPRERARSASNRWSDSGLPPIRRPFSGGGRKKIKVRRNR